MIRPLIIVLLAVVVSFPQAFAGDEIPGKPQTQPIVLKNATVHTGAGNTLRSASVVFDNGVVTAVGANVQTPAKALEVDCSGKHVYPGFIAPYTTIGITEIDAVRSTRDMSESGDLNPNARAETAYNPDSEIIPTIRSHGVLIANVAPNGGTISGTASVMRLDGWTREDIAIVPRAGLVVTWPNMEIYTGPGSRRSADEQKKEIAEEISKLKAAFASARTYSVAARAGVDTAKRDIRMESVRPVFESKMTVFINAGSQKQIEAALDFAEEFQIKIVIVGGADAREVADRLRKASVPVILDRVHALPNRADDNYDDTYTLPSDLLKLGVEFCLSDGGSWQQRNLPNQAGSAMAFGLTEDEAIRSISSSAAKILGIDNKYGSIETGKSATLFVSEGDALDGKSNIVTHAWIDGKQVDLNNRHKKLAKKYKARPAR